MTWPSHRALDVDLGHAIGLDLVLDRLLVHVARFVDLELDVGTVARALSRFESNTPYARVYRNEVNLDPVDLEVF